MRITNADEIKRIRPLIKSSSLLKKDCDRNNDFGYLIKIRFNISEIGNWDGKIIELREKMDSE